MPESKAPIPEDELRPQEPAAKTGDIEQPLDNASDVDAAFAADEGEDPGDSATLQQQLVEANERLLRTQAELENFRRRSRRELDDERKYAVLPLMQDLLPVVDNLRRAMESASQAEDISQLVDGIEMVASQIISTFERYHCKPIEAKGQAFDPNLHEAIAQIPSSEHPAGTIVEEAVTGYQLHDRVIRASQVLVSRGPDETAGDASPQKDEQ